MKQTSYILTIIILILMGCKSTKELTSPSDYIINDFSLTYNGNSDKYLFNLNSPIATINPKSKDIITQSPFLILELDNTNKLVIKSKQGLVKNNGSEIDFIGNVTINSFGINNFQLKANKINWDNKTNSAQITGDLITNINSSTISSRKATYSFDNHMLVFNNIKSSNITDQKNKSIIEIEAESIEWDRINNLMTFKSNKRQINTKVFLID